MARKAESDLYELIHSLSKVEKQTFKLYANYYSQGQKQHLRLFEWIGRQKQYDETILKKKLKQEGIKTPLARLKHYLFELITKSLRLHYSSASIDGELRNLFSDVEVFHIKGLIKLRDKQLGKLKSFAQKHEKYELLLAVLENEWFINIKTEERRRTISSKMELINKIIEKETFHRLNIDVVELCYKGLIRNIGTQKLWHETMCNPMLDLNKIPVGFEEAYYYSSVWVLYYEMFGEAENAIQLQKQIISKIECDRSRIKDHIFMRYIVGLNTLMGMLIKNKYVHEHRVVFDKMNILMTWDLNMNERNKLVSEIITAYSNWLIGLIQTFHFTELTVIRRQSEAFLQKHKNIESFNKSHLLYAIQYSYLVAGDFKKALYFSNLFLSEPDNKYYEEIYSTVKIVQLVIHYELEHVDLLPYITRSTYRYLKKRNNLYKTESVILNFIRSKIPKANTRKELIGFFKDLKVELEKVFMSPFEANALEHFDYITWLESKIKGKTMVEVYDDKNRNLQ